MLFQFGWLAAGVMLLMFAGDALVRGSVAAAIKAGVSPLIAGIVIVGFGTSVPEMLVSWKPVSTMRIRSRMEYRRLQHRQSAAGACGSSDDRADNHSAPPACGGP